MKKTNCAAVSGYVAVLGMAFSLTAGIAVAKPGTPPCSASTESRQFDFWLGDWSVSYPGAAEPSSSKVYAELDECVIVESWDGGKGHSGKNMFAYSADDKHWHGMFADNHGRVHVFEGTVGPGAAEFYGPSRSESGAVVLNRIKVTRISGDKVEQTWEKSADKGATWTTEYRGEYSRLKP
jgi:hypothetical protein